MNVIESLIPFVIILTLVIGAFWLGYEHGKDNR